MSRVEKDVRRWKTKVTLKKMYFDKNALVTQSSYLHYICLPGGSFAAIIAAPAYTYVECFALPAVCATLNYVYESIVFCCNRSRAAQCWWGIVSVPEELLKEASSGFGRWGKSYFTFLWEQENTWAESGGEAFSNIAVLYVLS